MSGNAKRLSTRRLSCRWRAGALLGETPVWQEDLGCLDFIDAPRGDVLRYFPGTGRHERMHVASELGFLARGPGGRLWCGTGLDVAGLSNAGSIAPDPVTVPGDPLRLRLNDASVDTHGDVWTGTMDRSGVEAVGGLFRISSCGACEQFDDGFTIPNGFAFSSGERELYVADSPRGIVFRFDIGPRGQPGRRVDWLHIDRDDGVPDGMTIDSENHLWVALFGGASLRRYRPDATLERELRVPTRNVTSCAFGGTDLDVLYITTAAMDGPRTWRTMLSHHYGGALFSCQFLSSGITRSR